MRLSPPLAAVCLGLVVACGGSDSVTASGIKSCAEDPTQALCKVMPPATDSGLRYYVSRTSRSMGTALDVTFGTSTAYDALVAREFNLVTAGKAPKQPTLPPLRAGSNFVPARYMFEVAQGHSLEIHA